jgi:hypothetical protein
MTPPTIRKEGNKKKNRDSGRRARSVQQGGEGVAKGKKDMTPSFFFEPPEQRKIYRRKKAMQSTR